MSVSTESPLSARVSRAELVARELEREIAGGLAPGERLGTKDDLRQRFGVAVATVNEAVRLLETRGLGAASEDRRALQNGPLRRMYLALIDFLEFSIDRAELSDFDGAAMVAVHRDLVEAIDVGEGPQLDAAIEAHRPATKPRSERWRR